MKLDYSNFGDAEKEFQFGRCLVDGIEVKQVWFVDTEEGYVKTYDVLGDGKPHASVELASKNVWPPDGERWEMPAEGVVSKTVRGCVELFRADGSAFE